MDVFEGKSLSYHYAEPPASEQANKDFADSIKNLAKEINGKRPEKSKEIEDLGNSDDLNFSRKNINEQLVQIGYDLSVLSNRFIASQKEVSEMMLVPEINDDEYAALEEALAYLAEFQLSIEDVTNKNKKLLSTLKESLGQFVRWKNKTKKSPNVEVISYIKDNENLTLRPIGQAQLIYQLFNSNNRSFAKTNDINKIADVTKYPYVNCSEKYALQVIDRKDGELKIIELSKTSYVALCKIALTIFTEGEFLLTGFGIADGFDFTLSRHGKMLQTRYAVQLIGKTKLTNEEMQMVQRRMTSDMSKACGQIEDLHELKKKLGV